MYAIARIAGKQFRIAPDMNIKVPSLKLAEGAAFDVVDILLAVDDQGTRISADALKNVKAKTKVVAHGREPKIVVFRKKRRQGFKVTRGHRQGFTLLHVEKFEGLKKTAAKAAKPKKEVKPKAAPPKSKTAAAQKETPKPKAKPKKKPAAKPKTETKPKKAPAKKKTEGE